MQIKKQNRSFLLLEMLIAIFLVSISAAPFLTSTLSFFRSELKQLELIEAQRIAELSFFEVKSLLYQNEIPWSSIPKNQTDAKLRRLPEFSMQIPGFDEKKIQRNYLLWGPSKEGISEQSYKKIHVLITLEIPNHKSPSAFSQQKKFLSPYQFHYQVFAQKSPSLVDRKSQNMHKEI